MMKQRFYGIILIFVGILACLMFREDVSAGVVLILMGLAVSFAKEMGV